MPNSYARLGIALAISLVLMFLLTMSMVDVWDHFMLNESNFYMAVIMVAPMGIVMLLVMWGMFPNRTLNFALLGVRSPSSSWAPCGWGGVRPSSGMRASCVR